jgi:hypothetical protein
MMSMLPTEEVNDPKFHWWTKTLPVQHATITELYTDSALSSAYASGAVAGTVLYAKVAEATAKEFRPGHSALFRKVTNTDQVDYRYDKRGKVVQRVLNGANSYVAIRLFSAASATYDLDEVTSLTVVGNTNAQGATMPDVVAYDPVQHTNVTQIFRTPLSITRTARKTRLRTDEQYQESKREALELHSMEMEKALLWGEFYEGIGDNGMPETATRGLIPAIIENEPNNVSAYHLDSDYTGTTWLNGGEAWLDSYLEVIYRHGSMDKIAFCGNKVALALKQIASNNAQVNLEPVTVSYGIRLMKWEHQFGTLFYKTHPLFNHNAAFHRDMVVFELSKLRSRAIDDTFFIDDPQDRRNRNHSKDGTDEEWITEIGLEYHHTPCFGYLSGFGIDNPV